MLKLKLQYFGHLMWPTDSLEKPLMLGKIEGMRRRGRQKTRWMDGIIGLMDMSLSKLRKIVKDRKGSGEEISLVQGKKQQLCFAGAAVKTYPRPR